MLSDTASEWPEVALFYEGCILVGRNEGAVCMTILITPVQRSERLISDLMCIQLWRRMLRRASGHEWSLFAKKLRVVAGKHEKKLVSWPRNPGFEQKVTTRGLFAFPYFVHRPKYPARPSRWCAIYMRIEGGSVLGKELIINKICKVPATQKRVGTLRNVL